MGAGGGCHEKFQTPLISLALSSPQATGWPWEPPQRTACELVAVARGPAGPSSSAQCLPVLAGLAEAAKESWPSLAEGEEGEGCE